MSLHPAHSRSTLRLKYYLQLFVTVTIYSVVHCEPVPTVVNGSSVPQQEYIYQPGTDVVYTAATDQSDQSTRKNEKSPNDEVKMPPSDPDGQVRKKATTNRERPQGSEKNSTNSESPQGRETQSTNSERPQVSKNNSINRELPRVSGSHSTNRERHFNTPGRTRLKIVPEIPNTRRVLQGDKDTIRPNDSAASVGIRINDPDDISRIEQPTISPKRKNKRRRPPNKDLQVGISKKDRTKPKEKIRDSTRIIQERDDDMEYAEPDYEYDGNDDYEYDYETPTPTKDLEGRPNSIRADDLIGESNVKYTYMYYDTLSSEETFESRRRIRDRSRDRRDRVEPRRGVRRCHRTATRGLDTRERRRPRILCILKFLP